MGRTFCRYPCVLCAVDVTFQDTNRLLGNIDEVKPYYFAKHKLHGYKDEVSVTTSGLSTSCSLHFPGNLADISIFTRRLAIHKKLQ